jgi:hypothetical protein
VKIHIRKGAGLAYFHRCYRKAHPQCGMLHNPEWVKKLQAIEETWVEVETDHLFRDQFNTVPIPGVSENGLRLMVEDIDAIEDDVRQGVVKCLWCGGYDHDHDGKCDKCGKEEYLEPLNPISPVQRG